MGGSATHFLEVLEANRRQGLNMAMCFTQPIRHGVYCRHSATPLSSRRRTPCPKGLNLGTYNIRYGRGFGLPQAICAIDQGNCDLMLLTDKNIPDVLYCHNHLGCDFVCSNATVTAAGGGQGGVRIV